MRRMFVTIGSKRYSLAEYLRKVEHFEYYHAIRSRLYRMYCGVGEGDILLKHTDMMLTHELKKPPVIKLYRIYMLPGEDGFGKITVTFGKHCSYDPQFEVMRINERDGTYSTNKGKSWGKIRSSILGRAVASRRGKYGNCAKTGRCDGCATDSRRDD